MIQTVFLSMIWPVSLSLFGAAFFGYQRDPYITIIVWSVICTTGFLLWSMSSLRLAINLLRGSPKPYGHAIGLILSITTTVFLPFIGAQSAVYFLALHFAN